MDDRASDRERGGRDARGTNGAPRRESPGAAPRGGGEAGRSPADPGLEPDLGPEADLERSRHLRRLSRYLQAGGIAFLAVVSLGLLPAILSASYPAVGARAAVLVWIAAPAIPIVLLVVAAFRLPR